MNTTEFVGLYRLARFVQINLQQRAEKAAPPVSHWLKLLTEVAGTVADTIEEGERKP